jgi:hypothetical protein
MNFSGTITSDFMKLAEIPIQKRPSLINFAATDFVSLRNSLINYAKAVYPTEYQYFVESDLGIMFIELVAYMGSVMSMKADMLANENFLATANQRASVKKLLELIGVRMRGPLSAAADAQITWDLTPGDTTKISLANRTFNVTSPEDGGGVTYTLYKVVNGLVDEATANGSIELTTAESDNADNTVFSNLVLQEGALVTDSGDFAATEGTKTIKLTQNPVVEGSIQVYITAPDASVEGAYTEVDNIYFASGSSDRIFEVVYDGDYGATIVFGDGTAGISPDDTASYFVQYRVGGGTRGNIVKNALNVTVNGSVGENSKTGTLTNTSVGVGGANAETLDHAKRWAPLTFRRQDRLVTLEDYSVFANTYISDWGTIGKALAAIRKAYASANTLDIYVLEKASDFQLQKATPNFKTNLLTAINKKKMATDEVVIVDGLIRTFDLVTTIRIDEEQKGNQNQIIGKVRRKILDYMNVDNRDFGEALYLSELNRQIFEVDEVRFSTIDNLTQDVRVDFNEIIQLNNLTIKIELLE